jgi:hypothetical protein
MNIQDYLIPLDKLDLKKVLSTWTWLTGDKSIVALTKAGDALLKDKIGGLYFLNVGFGTIELKSNNYHDLFDKKLGYELTDELLFSVIVDMLELHGKILKEDQVYSYIMLPILGGAYNEENMFPCDIYEHYNLTGEIHLEIKDKPDGSKVEIIVE